ncbi:choice-of-anchor I family protein [Paenibacillus plantarum]|nr:choice-of-anchor I family protein [Paenibacillus plantarum]
MDEIIQYEESENPVKKVGTKVVSVLLSVAVTISSLAIATPASAVAITPGTPYQANGTYDVTIPHVFINQVYGGGLVTDTKNTASSHGFIELYNPTSNDVSLTGWSLQYADRGTDALTGPTGDWQKLNLVGTIKAKSSFLIRGEATLASAPKLNLTTTYDQLWNNRFINNKGLKVVLMSNQTKLDITNKNPFSNAPKPTGYVDMLGTGSNDGDNVDVKTDIDGFELEYPRGSSEGTSKKISVRRKALTDTDNNKQDFVQFGIADSTTQELAVKGPKSGAFGQWDNNVSVLGYSNETFPIAYEQEDYSVSMNVYGGRAPFTFAATGLPAGLAINTVTGEVYGKPTEVVTSNVYIKVTDSLLAQYGRNLTIKVEPASNLFKDTLSITKLTDFQVGITNSNGGVAEIVKYNKDNNKFYLVNGSGNPPSLDIVRLDLVQGLVKEKTIKVKDLVENNGFLYGDLTSVDVNTTTKKVSVSVQELDSKKAGKIVVLDYDGNIVKTYDAGIQPDMIKSTTDGRYILTANEGEPRTAGIDPEGSITIVDTIMDSVTQLRFADPSVIDNKVHIRGASNPIQITGEGTKQDAIFDLEPEYIALSEDNSKAYVSFQENNAIGTIDLATKAVISIKGLGLKDLNLPRNSLDLVKDNAIKFENVPFYGMYMPDGIASQTINGIPYVFSANEGDVTEWPGVRLNGSTIGAMKGSLAPNSPAAQFLAGKTTYDGVEVASDMGSDSIYLYGGRSFSIWQANTMAQVYDSGNEFEKVTAQRVPNNFNTSNSKTALDDRSSKKGPEPEDVKVGKVGSKTLAFVGLERVGGIMTYDVSDPVNAKFVNYTNSRVFTPKDNLNTDTGPEGIDFIPAAISPNGNPLLLVANEVGGTVAVYQLNVQRISVDRSALSVTKGDAASKLTATVTTAAGDAVGTGTITWKSSNSAVATVSAEGLVSAVDTGSAVITAISPDGYATAEVPVTVSSSGTSSSSGPGPVGGTQPSQPTTNGEMTTITMPTVKDSKGTSTANLTAAQVTDALKQMTESAGKSSILEIKATVDATSKEAVIKLPAESLVKVADSSTAAVKLDLGIGSVTLDKNVLAAITSNAATGEVSLSIAKADLTAVTQHMTAKDSDAVKAAIGDRPVFDFTITAGGKTVSTFNGGSVEVQIPYKPAANEDTNAIIAFYIADNGELVKVSNSYYDAATGTLIFKVSHFSQYAVGYSPVAFGDTSATFAKSYITYLAARNIINGTAEGQFSPNAQINRADFTLMLARMAGVNLSAYNSSIFRDVKADSYYAQSVQWAAKNSLTSGVSEGVFAPAANISREQMVTMIARFAKLQKFTLPQALSAAPFADGAEIPAFAVDAAKALQQAGIISGKSGNTFAPKDFASREEAAKMLGMLLQQIVK